MIITVGEKKLEYYSPITVGEIARAQGEEVRKAALCGKVDGVLVDIDFLIEKDAAVEIITFDKEEGRRVFNHTAAHILAQAVKMVFPTAKLAIGPSIENGFYYDFDFKTPITVEDLPRIETEMKKLIKANLPIVKNVYSRSKALDLMKKAGEIYKVELINDLPQGEQISFYQQGDFADLCRGPHLKSTRQIKAIKLTNLTGAYWKGNVNNKMLTRIYGIAFDKKSKLEEYLTAVEEAKQRDHNKLGRELELFMTSEVVGQGLPLLMPKGAKVMQILQRFVEDEEERRGYLFTKTPFMAKSDLYKISGHWSHYKDKMFVVGEEAEDDEVLALRPMTCPYQYQIYNNGLKSYRDLPVRYAETSTLFRNEASGEMHGLIRVRQFTLSDGHIICMPSQIEEEFKNCLDLSYYFLDCLGLRDMVTFRFSKWDSSKTDKYINNPEAWERTQSLMKKILEDLKLEYCEAEDEAAFYGPKLDIQAKNVHGKEDTIITIQIDFCQAELFGMTYIDEKGEKQTPYIIHRSSIGCYERTLAMIIEKYAGALPLWLSPIQTKVFSLTERTSEDAIEVNKLLASKGIRSELDIRDEKVGRKIREAQLEKIPYMIIIGDKEKESGVIAVRSRKEGDIGTMTTEDFVARLNKEASDKSI